MRGRGGFGAGAGDRRFLLVITGLLAIVMALVSIGMIIGERMISWSALLEILFQAEGSRIDQILVWTLRLPRSLAACLGGAGLAVSGYLLQTLTRNPLAGPGLTGVSYGAVAPIVACFVFFPGLSSVLYPWVGLAGGFFGAALTFWIARGGGGRPLALALGGISVSLFMNAVTSYVLILGGSQAPSLLFWLSGGFQGRSWSQLAYMAPWVVVGIVGALACRRVLGLLMLDEQAAAGMGVNLALWKPVLLGLAVILVAGVVPVAGPVAFIGVSAPHIARLLRPAGPGRTIALTAVVGALIVGLADLVARTIALPQEIPIGVLTALIGGPVFLVLVQGRGAALGGRG